MQFCSTQCHRRRPSEAVPSESSPRHDISDLGAPFIKQVDKMMHFRNLEKAFNSIFHLTIRWETKEKMKEMAGVIEKQEFKIETLKRLYKAK